jgi:hypothetical protein
MLLRRETLKFEGASGEHGPVLRRRPGWAVLGHMGHEVRCNAVKALGWNEDLNRSMDFEFIWLLICI